MEFRINSLAIPCSGTRWPQFIVLSSRSRAGGPRGDPRNNPGLPSGSWIKKYDLRGQCRRQRRGGVVAATTGRHRSGTYRTWGMVGTVGLKWLAGTVKTES